MRTTLVIVGLSGCLSAAQVSEVVNSSKLARGAPKLPNLSSAKPLYGLFLFGEQGEAPVWAVLDQSRPQASVYDVLFLDLNGDGDLTQTNEQFSAKLSLTAWALWRGDRWTQNENFTANSAPARAVDEVSCTFEIGRIQEPRTGRVHNDFSITWRPHRLSYQMRWLGEKLTMGAYGTDPQSHGKFSPSPETAPVLVPGHDRPLQFQHWMSETLRRDLDIDFKVTIGNVGVGPGSFSCVDEKFLPPDDYVVGTLLYKDKSGAQRSLRFDMKRRC